MAGPPGVPANIMDLFDEEDDDYDPSVEYSEVSGTTEDESEEGEYTGWDIWPW